MKTPAPHGPRPLKIDLRLGRALVLLAILAGLFWTLGALQSIITQLLVAMGIAYLLDPLVDRLQRLVKLRSVAIVLLLVPLAGLITLLAMVVVPRLIDELLIFVSKVPGMFQVALSWTLNLIVGRFQVELPNSVGEILNRFGSEITDAVPSVLSGVKSAVGGIYSGSAGFFRGVTGAVIVPVFSVYLLYDFDRILSFFRDLLPRRYEAQVMEHLREIDEGVGRFIRGQLTVCAILGTLYSVGFSLVGLKMALFLGIFTGILAIVPYAGAAIGFITALLSALVWFQSWWVVLGVVLVFVTVQSLDALFITPRVLGSSVNLSPVLVIISLMVGGKLLGFGGVLIAVPAAASLRVLLRSLIRWYKKTSWYLDPGPPGRHAPGKGPPSPPPDPPPEAQAGPVEARPTEQAEGLFPADEEGEAAERQGTAPFVAVVRPMLLSNPQMAAVTLAGVEALPVSDDEGSQEDEEPAAQEEEEP